MESHLDFFGEADWRKRIGQLKQELRSAEAGGKVTIPEQAKPYGSERKPKRAATSAQLSRRGR